jgi:hypothetical protein
MPTLATQPVLNEFVVTHRSLARRVLLVMCV